MIRKTAFIGILAILIGAIASLSATAFVFLVKQMNQWLLVDHQWRITTELSVPLVVILILIPTVGGLIVGFLCRDIPQNRPLSLVDSIQSAQSMRFKTTFWQSLKTAIAGVISLGSGASLGQYGPVAHLGSAMGLVIRQITRSTVFTPAMALGCGVAAAISTVFNAPIAGLIFAHEVILRHYSLRTFAPITVASVIGYLIANYFWNSPVMFPVETHERIHFSEYAVFVGIGVAGAYLAAAFIKLVLWFTAISNRLSINPVFKPACAGAAIGIAGLWVPEILGIGDSVANEVLSGNSIVATELLIILLMKVLGTALCLGFGMAGGVFSPSIFMGLLFGAIIGSVIAPTIGVSFSSIVPYIVCGMVAVASPIIGAPLTSILIIFELSRNYDLAVAAMVSVVFANMIAYQLVGRSLFDSQLSRLGFNLREGREAVILSSRTIADFIENEVTIVNQNTSLIEVKNNMLINDVNSAFVVDKHNILLGEITLLTIINAEDKMAIEGRNCLKYSVYPKTILYPNTTIWDALEKVQSFVGECIAVVDENNRLLGVVYEASIVKAYMQTLKSVRRDENGVD